MLPFSPGMGRGRRVDAGGGVRDCLDHRAVDVVGVGRTVVGGTRPPKAGLLERNAAVGTESTSELLRQLPYALGGYRLPHTADPVPGIRIRGGAGSRGPPEDYSPLTQTTPVNRDRRLQANPRGHSVGAHVTAGARRQLRDPAEVRDPGRQRPELSCPWLPEPRAADPVQPHVRRMRSEGVAALQQMDELRSAAPSREGCVAFVSKAVEPNSQFRPYMEDRYVSIDPFMPGEMGDEQWSFYAVYDGHGGAQAAVHCESELHKLLSADLRTCMRHQGSGAPLSDDVIADALVQSFQKIDDQLRVKGAYRHGTTATVALARRSKTGVRLHVANVGDSRALAVDERGAVRLSQDHRPTDPSEARRIQQGGGFVSMGRVSGELAVSRALGDHHLKNAGLTCHPFISVRDASRDDALVIASDGLWDSISDADVRAVIAASRGGSRQEQTAQRLVEDAKRRGSMDNIACLVAFL